MTKRLLAATLLLLAPCARADDALLAAESAYAHARRTGDERALREASPTDGDSARALVLEARRLQRRHRFDDALAVLDRADAATAPSASSLRLRASIRLVRGEYPQSRRAAASLAFAGDRFGALALSAIVAGETGDPARADDLFRSALGRADGATAEDLAWCLIAMAENAARAGRPEDARAAFGQALALAPGDAYAVCALADFLLDRGEPAEALAALDEAHATPGVLLRRALAQHAAGLPEAERSIATLADFFRAEGDSDAHLRERARFELELRGDPRAALDAAQRNWAIQREPADTLLLVRAAAACSDPAPIAAVAAWMTESGFRDPLAEGMLENVLAAR